MVSMLCGLKKPNPKVVEPKFEVSVIGNAIDTDEGGDASSSFDYNVLVLAPDHTERIVLAKVGCVMSHVRYVVSQ